MASKCLGQGWSNWRSHRYSSWCGRHSRREQKIPILQGAHPALPCFPCHIRRNVRWYVAAYNPAHSSSSLTSNSRHRRRPRLRTIRHREQPREESRTRARKEPRSPPRTEQNRLRARQGMGHREPLPAPLRLLGRLHGRLLDNSQPQPLPERLAEARPGAYVCAGRYAGGAAYVFCVGGRRCGEGKGKMGDYQGFGSQRSHTSAHC